jgi:hypothetical protein
MLISLRSVLKSIGLVSSASALRKSLALGFRVAIGVALHVCGECYGDADQLADDEHASYITA